MMFHYYYNNFGTGFPVFPFLGIFFNVLFWGFLIYLVVALLRGGSSRSQDEGNDTVEEDTALQILRERYAKGEINKRQFVEMKRDLKD